MDATFVKKNTYFRPLYSIYFICFHMFSYVFTCFHMFSYVFTNIFSVSSGNFLVDVKTNRHRTGYWLCSLIIIVQLQVHWAILMHLMHQKRDNSWRHSCSIGEMEGSVCRAIWLSMCWFEIQTVDSKIAFFEPGWSRNRHAYHVQHFELPSLQCPSFRAEQSWLRMGAERLTRGAN